ncbi:unnamed protein product [Cylicocyclus nassatus]|uniref:Uncharacterized protein n=1 Tax=Cylicocyclus nassatus TaxID=53992 RepID=A0AA36MIB5_CYLNA|nr:unnamed protein product [Cylicocyclus nassatus]
MHSSEKRRLELGIFKTRKSIKEEDEDLENVTKEEEAKDELTALSEQKTSSKLSDSKKPSIFMRKKKTSECFADTRVDKKKIAREATQKTILLESAPRQVVLEKVSLSVTEPGFEACRPPSDLSGTSTANSSFTCAQLVEQKLQEITREAQNLAAAAGRKARQEDQTTVSEVSSLVADSEDCQSPDHCVRVEIASPVLKASKSFSPSRSHHLCNSEPQHHLAAKQRVSDLKSIAEATQRIFDETKEMSRHQSMNTERNRESLADRLSKGIHELTQGSTDRLQRWKTKLQAGGHGRRQKDQSEPPPIRRPPVLTDAEAIPVWTDRYPRPLHPSRSASNALQINQILAAENLGKEGMDHRTLKMRENSASQKDLSFHYQHMSSLQSIMNTLDGYTKGNFDNPPPRILPISGMKPSNDGIIRPVAFRPVPSQNDEQTNHQTNNITRVERQVIRGDLTKSTTNVNQMISAQLQRSRAIFQPSTSFTSQKPQENEYDTVPDYIEKEKLSDFGSSASDYGSYHHIHPPTKMTSSTASSGTHSSGSQLSSPPSTNKKPYQQSGRVSALHVTPSPSDSGIVDYETLIRDKENELRVVRNTMEQNEEIIVKVYQEKERAWKEELEHLRSRLSASEKGENALRAQLAGCQKQTDNMSRTIDGLRDEKTGLLRKCFQLEREMAQMKLELDKPRECEECRLRNGSAAAFRRTQDGDVSLRSEVASLRDEVATLKEALTAQMQVFTDERKKWERDPGVDRKGQTHLSDNCINNSLSEQLDFRCVLRVTFILPSFN